MREYFIFMPYVSYMHSPIDCKYTMRHLNGNNNDKKNNTNNERHNDVIAKCLNMCKASVHQFRTFKHILMDVGNNMKIERTYRSLCSISVSLSPRRLIAHNVWKCSDKHVHKTYGINVNSTYSYSICFFDLIWIERRNTQLAFKLWVMQYTIATVYIMDYQEKTIDQNESNLPNST